MVWGFRLILYFVPKWYGDSGSFYILSQNGMGIPAHFIFCPKMVWGYGLILYFVPKWYGDSGSFYIFVPKWYGDSGPFYISVEKSWNPHLYTTYPDCISDLFSFFGFQPQSLVSKMIV